MSTEKLKALNDKFNEEWNKRPDSLATMHAWEEIANTLMCLSGELIALWDAVNAMTHSKQGKSWNECLAMYEIQRQALDALNDKAKEVLG